MIQEIGRHTLSTDFAKPMPQDADYVLLFQGTDVLLVPETGSLPHYTDWLSCGGTAEQLVHLLEVDGVQFFTALDLPEEIARNFTQETSRVLRKVEPRWLRLASVTCLHLVQWQRTHRFCGVCGAPMLPDQKELAMRCTNADCHAVTYPTVCPAVIVGVRNGDRILLTRSSVYKNPVYALVSGYMSVGETMEETVHREVLEETGLHVKNLQYCGNQPWGFSGAQMIGYWAELDGSDIITLQEDELKSAGWYTPEEIPPAYEDDPLDLTHYMIEQFRARRLPGQK
ncbi:MAG TPA: NAD(+) diphosphatase [Clostridiales bacterium]|nr:NAD(+) diphosphatase [Clostridiales bacterium]